MSDPITELARILKDCGAVVTYDPRRSIAVCAECGLRVPPGTIAWGLVVSEYDDCRRACSPEHAARAVSNGGGTWRERRGGAVSNRPETGPMKFGEDWTGVFIRGDNAHYYGTMLRELLDAAESAMPEHVLQIAVLRGLVDDLAGSDEGARPDVQRLREWAECVLPESKP